MKEKIKGKKKVIIAVLVLLLIGGGVAGGIVYTSTSDAKDKTAATEETVTIIDKDTGEETVVDADSTKAKEAAKDSSVVIKKDTKKDSAKKSSSNKTTAKKATSNKTTAKKPTGTKPNSSKPSSGNSASNASAAKPTKPAHSHSWEPVYGTKTVTYYEKKWVGSVTICNACGAKNPSSAHLDQHIDNGGNGSTHAEEIYESVPVQRTEQYIKGYRCSCGATK